MDMLLDNAKHFSKNIFYIDLAESKPISDFVEETAKCKKRPVDL
jgi:hypothetical protein